MAWDLNGDTPIYLQIMEQVKLRVVSGIYPAGSKLPSVRDMAAEAAVNPNTVQKALSELERESLIYSERTSGRFVTKDIAMVNNVKYNLAESIIMDFINKMENLGYKKDDLIKEIENVSRRSKQ